MADNETRLYRVKGMDCASCAQTVEKGVARLAGIDQISLNFTTETLKIRGTTRHEEIADRVKELGYQLVDPDEEEREEGGRATPPANFLRYMLRRRDTVLALVGALLILPGLIFNELLPMLGLEHWLLDLTSVAALLTAGYPIARSAWRAVRINRDININVLMTIASVGAVFIGAYTEAGLVMVLFALGEALEGYTADRARNAIRGLVEMMPQEATVLRPCLDCAGHMGQNGYTGGPCPFCGLEEHQVPVEELRVGETIVVRPGERIPMDGRVIEGISAVNQAPITGESQPALKEVGSDVFASTVNGAGVLKVEVTHLAKDNTISRLIQMVEEAQEKRAPAQRFVDRFAEIYTPAVVLLAVLVAVLPPLLFGAPFLSTAANQGWLYRALALLVVACPCALVISTPVSIISAVSNAARNGVLFKGGVFLEALSRIRAIAFDKTGTLTRGEPAVVRVQASDCRDLEYGLCTNCDELLALASAVEHYSEHPLARAVLEAAKERGVHGRYQPADAVRALTGRGVTGRVAEKQVVVGSHRYFDEAIPHRSEACRDIRAHSDAGHTPMLVSVDDTYRGYIAVADTVRRSSRRALAALKDAGVETLVMLTGDDTRTAETIAREVGVTDVRANLLPEDKVTAVEELLRHYQYVAMVGDGINDAPALARATVGIAMGAAGTAQAMETADVALMNDDLSHLPFAVRLSRATMRTIWVNVFLSLAIKAVFLIIVLLGMGTMWMAVLADMGASLLVTLNGTRLLRWSDKQRLDIED